MQHLSRTSQAHRPENAGCLERLNRFASEHRLREMKFSGRATLDRWHAIGLDRVRSRGMRHSRFDIV